MFAAIPPVVSTVKFVYSSRQGLFRFVRRLPWLCVVEVMYLVTSIKLPPHAQGNHPSGSTSQEAFVMFLNVSLPFVLTRTLTVPMRHFLRNHNNLRSPHPTFQTHWHIPDPNVTVPFLDATSHPYLS